MGERDLHKRWFSDAVSTNAVILNFHAEATATEHLHEGYEIIEEDKSTQNKLQSTKGRQEFNLILMKVNYKTVV